MKLAEQISRIELRDGGDGSTFFCIDFIDGSSFSDGPDVPYDGKVIYDREPGGKLIASVEYA